MVTLELIDALKARYQLRSDYAAAKKLGVEPTTVYRYRKQHGQMDESTAIKVAELLEMNPGEVLARIQAERTDRPEVRKVWESVAKTLHGTAAGIFALVLGGLLLTANSGEVLAFIQFAAVPVYLIRSSLMVVMALAVLLIIGFCLWNAFCVRPASNRFVTTNS